MIRFSSSLRRGFCFCFTLLTLLWISTGASGQAIPLQNGDKIAFLGDSITNFGWSHPDGYVRLIMLGLEVNEIKTAAIPAGISGNTSKDMLARLERDVISRHPVWMTLSCGVNDVWHGKTGVELEPYKQNITSIVDQCQTAGIKVMILSATMITEDPEANFNKQLAGYNDFLAKLAVEKHCLFADLNGAMQASVTHGVPGQKVGNALTVDGVHMNSWGNQMMADGVLKAFGLNDMQLSKARQAWQKIQLPFPGKGTLSLQQYEQLATLAASQHLTTDELIDKAFSRTVEDLLKSSGITSTQK